MPNIMRWFEYAHKWAEVIGRHSITSHDRQKAGGVIINQEDGDQRFARRLRAVAQQQGIRVWTVKPRELE